MPELLIEKRLNELSSHFTWPVDILHISDLHFSGDKWFGQNRTEGNWQVFLSYVRENLSGDHKDGLGQFTPAIIAFTGDLVETAGSLTGFRRGVNALLDLAHCCKFLSEPPVHWSTKEKVPPQAWEDLLNRRIFIVPGNHDIYPIGLRMFWQRWSRNWLKISKPQIAAVADMLAIMMIDSNSKRAFWKYARGEVEQQLSLQWPADLNIPDNCFRIALMHAHPVQMPYFLEGVTNAEASMVMENAGLLMKNLVNLRVRLILHGHRHYPGVCTLRIPDGRGDLRTITVVGAGSVTKPPHNGWSYYAFNWIRIHPDQRIEIFMGKRVEQENSFSIAVDHPFLADTGDFQYAEVVKSVDIKDETGDIDVTIRALGFRVKPGRPPVSRIPFTVSSGKHENVAAWYFRCTGGGAVGTTLRWDEEQRYIEFNPPHREEAPPMDLEVHYYVHNSVAMTSWEAKEIYESKPAEPEVGTCEQTTITVLCDTGQLRLKVTFPEGRPISKELRFPEASPWRAEVKRDRVNRDTEASDELTRSIKWHRGTHCLSAEYRFPHPSSRCRLYWHIPQDDELPNDFLARISAIWPWQRSLIESSNRGICPFNKESEAIASIIDQEFRGIGRVDVSLFVGSTNDNRTEKGKLCELRLVGANFTPTGDPSSWSIPFGAGVVGRAFRTGKVILRDVHREVQTREAYMRGDGNSPRNFDKGFEKKLGRPEYVAALAVPVFLPSVKDHIMILENNKESSQAQSQRKMNEKDRTTVHPARCTILTVCIGTTDPASELCTWLLPEHAPAPQEKRFHEQVPHATDTIGMEVRKLAWTISHMLEETVNSAVQLGLYDNR